MEDYQRGNYSTDQHGPQSVTVGSCAPCQTREASGLWTKIGLRGRPTLWAGQTLTRGVPA
jgi:hypothetical protein